MPRPVAIKRLFIGSLLISLVALVVRLLAIQGWIIPARVTSGSMAETLLGEHFQVVCGQCGYPFHFGVESKPRDDLAVCPNCGWNGNKVRSESRGRGQRVLIDRGAYWFGSPARFDVVTFYDPASPGRLIVKRVVGLPGEQLAIRDGDLFINGAIVSKSLAQFRRSAVVVHDNRYIAKQGSEQIHRWKPKSPDSGWVVEGTGFRRAPPDHPLKRIPDFLNFEEEGLGYHHWRCYASPYPRFDVAPMSDNCGYNQGESRTLQNVSDHVLGCRVNAQGPGRFRIRMNDGRDWFELVLEPTRRHVEIKRFEQLVAAAEFPQGCKSELFDIEFGFLDQQVVLALDAKEVIRQKYDVGTDKRRRIVHLGIWNDSLHVSIHDLVIKRDVYYLDPANVGQPWQTTQPIPAGKYFVLGDNPSLSEDSRHWQVPCIPEAAIRGQVVPWR